MGRTPRRGASHCFSCQGFPEFRIESILSHKLQSRGRGRPVTIYLVKWQGFGDEHNTWEPEAGLTSDGLYENDFIKSYWDSIQPQDAQHSFALQQPQARQLRTAKVAVKRARQPLPKTVASKRARMPK